MFFRKKIHSKEIHSEEAKHTVVDVKKSMLPNTIELAKVSQDVFVSSKNLSECSKTLSQISEKVEDNINQDQIQLEKVSQEVGVIRVAAEDIYEKAKKNETLSSENRNNVSCGIGDLHKTVEQVETFFGYINQVSAEMEKLQAFSKSIGEITGYLDHISEKTTLVSINASIEAARVGEIGKGFMVITSEIKSLADQSKDFSKKINGMIEDMIGCMKELSENSKKNCDRMNDTKKTISMLEDKLEIVAQSTNQLDENIKGTLVSSNEIRNSVKVGTENVQALMESFNKTVLDSKNMFDLVENQHEIVSKFNQINEHTKSISESQLIAVLDDRMEEKLLQIGQKVAEYEGNRDCSSLKRFAAQYLLQSINYIDEKGCFETAANEKSIGFNIFKVEPQYVQFKASPNQSKAFPLSRNLFTGEITRYVVAKQKSSHQLISMGFNLNSLVKISEMSDEDMQQFLGYQIQHVAKREDGSYLGSNTPFTNLVEQM